MKHKLLSLFFAAIVAMNVYAVDVWDGSSDIFTHGAGTEQSPYLIENAEQLAFIAEMVNAGVYTYAGNYFKLTTDLDLNDLAWTPIGDATHKFGGNFDGDGHTISNLKITAATTNAGLFGVVSGGTYKKLTVQGSIASSANANNAGGLIAYATAACTIDSCINNVTIGEGANAGGIIGYALNATIHNCSNKGNITGTVRAGGIVAYAPNTAKTQITNCINEAKVNSQNIAGGILGTANKYDIVSCVNLNSIMVNKSWKYATTTSSKTISSGSVSFEESIYEHSVTTSTCIGGIVGEASSVNIKSCINSGDVKGQTTGLEEAQKIIISRQNWSPYRFELHYYNLNITCIAGGIAGRLNGTIIRCENKGFVENKDQHPSKPNNISSCNYNYFNSMFDHWKSIVNQSVSSGTWRTSEVAGYTETVEILNGGMIGKTTGESIIQLSQNKGDVSSSGAGICGGGSNTVTVSYSFNNASVKNGFGLSKVNVTNSYNAGSTSGLGISSGTVTNSYYINGSGNGTQKTDAQMKSVSMPILLNADSTVFIQDVQPYVNKGYPIFKHGMKYIATNDASDVSYTSAQLNGNYYNCNPTSMGFEYKKSSASSYSSKTITNASPAQHILTGLTQGTTYDVRYWLVDNGIKYYGEVVQFTTLACPTKPVRSDTVTLCNGESYSFAGQTLTQAGTYRDSLVATTGCDSVIELVLKVYDTYKYHQFDTINRGESYDFYGQMLTEPGVYNEYIRTTNRCNWVQLNLYVIEPPKTLTLNVNNPQWGSVTGTGIYEHGEVVEFSAVPAAGCYLVNWSDGETNAVRAMALTKDTTITANFAIHQFTITTEATNGSVSGGGSYNYGTQVTLTATADEHYHFVHWNDGNTEATRQITVSENKTYSAVFELDNFLVTFRNADGTELKSEEVEYGVMPIAPTDPTKESTARNMIIPLRDGRLLLRL